MWMSPHARDPQPRALVQLCVLGHRAMSRPQARHQLPVQTSLTPVRALVRHHEVVDQQLGVPALHSGYDGA